MCSALTEISLLPRLSADTTEQTGMRHGMQTFIKSSVDRGYRPATSDNKRMRGLCANWQIVERDSNPQIAISAFTQPIMSVGLARQERNRLQSRT